MCPSRELPVWTGFCCWRLLENRTQPGQTDPSRINYQVMVNMYINQYHIILHRGDECDQSVYYKERRRSHSVLFCLSGFLPGSSGRSHGALTGLKLSCSRQRSRSVRFLWRLRPLLPDRTVPQLLNGYVDRSGSRSSVLSMIRRKNPSGADQHVPGVRAAGGQIRTGPTG